MWDVILIATIIAFFVVAALLLRGLDRMITRSGDGADADLADETTPDDAAGRELEPGRRS
jgi:hypothetical protein